MNIKLKHDVRAVAGQFQIPGEFVSAEPYGSGHINDTYCVVFDQAGTRVRYIFQRINHNIFKNAGVADGKHPARHERIWPRRWRANQMSAGAC